MILEQMLKEKHENKHSTFATYYDSCMHYESTTNFSERIRMGKPRHFVKCLELIILNTSSRVIN